MLENKTNILVATAPIPTTTRAPGKGMAAITPQTANAPNIGVLTFIDSSLLFIPLITPVLIVNPSFNPNSAPKPRRYLGRETKTT